jgi:peptidoglycan/LPS O-acetylase OafA/YrhL
VKPNKKTALHSAICSIILFIVMMVFIIQNYIDFQVIIQIYLPIWAIAIIAILFRQYIFSYIFVSSAALGLIVEYIIHCHQPEPTMKGAFVNTLIICLGFIIGVVVQIVVTRNRRHSISKPT